MSQRANSKLIGLFVLGAVAILAIAAVVTGAVAGKWAGHRIGNVDFVRPGRSMSQIGG